MAENSTIAWTDHTFNPWMGCAKVSDGCANCYAEALVTGRMGKPIWGSLAKRQVTTASKWRKPVLWNLKARDRGRPFRVFCASLCDVFEDHPTAEAERPALFGLIRRTPHLDWLLLTKRPERINACLPDDWGDGWPHVWLGTSVENNDWVSRADELRCVPALVRFISYEPAIGPIDKLNLAGIHWLICGGESGAGFRPMNLKWARDARRACARTGTAFFFKQESGFRPGTGTLDGQLPREYPCRVRVRDVPERRNV